MTLQEDAGFLLISIMGIMVILIIGSTMTATLKDQKEKKFNESLLCVQNLADENWKNTPYPTDVEIQNYYNGEKKACNQQNLFFYMIWDGGGYSWSMSSETSCNITIHNKDFGEMTLEQYYNLTKNKEKYPLETREFMKETNYNKYMAESMRCWD